MYGKEGLHELSEIYLLNNPEEKDQSWPRSLGEWAAVQEEDEESKELKVEIIGREGGTTAMVGRSKYALRTINKLRACH